MYVPQILTAPLSPIAADAVPVGSSQSIWEWGYDGVEVGIWDCAPCEMQSPPADFDEAMVMVAGRATIDHDDGSFDLAPGTAWVTPRQWRSTWHVHQTIRKMYVIDHRPGSKAPAGYLSNVHHMALGSPTPRANPLAGKPMEASASLWNHNGLDVGVWEATAGSFTATRDGYDEVFVGLSGTATLTCTDGMRFDLSAGSMLFTPAGFKGRWDVSSTFRKAYVIIRRN